MHFKLMTKPPSIFPPGLSQKLKQHTVRSSTPKGQQDKPTILSCTTRAQEFSRSRGWPGGMVFRIFHFQATGSNQNQITMTENSSSCAAAPNEWFPAKQVQVTPLCSFLGWISSLACTGTSPAVKSSCTPGTSISPAILSSSIPMGFVPCQPSALGACCTTQSCHQTWLQLLLAQVPGELNKLFGSCSLRRCREANLLCRKEDGIPSGHCPCALCQQGQTYLTPLSISRLPQSGTEEQMSTYVYRWSPGWAWSRQVKCPWYQWASYQPRRCLNDSLEREKKQLIMTMSPN